MGVTQKTRILAALKMGPVCGTQMLGWFIPRYSARIWELRGEGYEITSELCRLHRHETPQVVYRLTEEDQLKLEI